MKYFHLVFLVSLLAIPFEVQATADGPDYWQVRPGAAAELHAQPSKESPVIKKIPPGTPSLKNLGCQGGPSFAEWSKMTPEQKEASKDQRWCQTEYGDKKGWVQNKYLREGSLSPSFDCAKAKGEIESLICAHPALAALDLKMDVTFKAAVEAQKKEAGGEAGLKMLKATQRGWVKGRNDCWKASDKQKCVKEEYQRRISWLEVRYALAPAGKPVWFYCNQNPKDEIVATFFQSQIPAVRLERGDRVAIGVQVPSGSGSKYAADFGVTFWTHGQDASVEWPQGTRFQCKLTEKAKDEGMKISR